MTWNKKQSPPLVSSAPRRPLLDDIRRQVAVALEELYQAQAKVRQLQADAAWLELNPEAENVFPRILARGADAN